MKNTIQLFLLSLAVLVLAACSPTAPATREPALPVEQPTSEPAAVEQAAAQETGSAPGGSDASVLEQFPDTPQTTQGELVVLYGKVLDVNGNPMENAVVEIWQTDAAGIYDYPNSPGTEDRDQNFQFFGVSHTDADGQYAFRTIIPGEYEPRPRHIHFKVKLDNIELLTSQFYFAGESGGAPAALTLETTPGTDAAGRPVVLASKDIVVAVSGGTGSLDTTPSQMEGPYYPVVDFSSFDNDLVVVK